MSSRSSITRLPHVRARRRIALYSHDAVGLGHVRRNLALAEAMGDADTDVLLVTGCPSAPMLPRPAGCDVVVLPAMAKTEDGYRSRFWSMDADEIGQVRAQTLQGVLTAFDPDLLVVDKHPVGLNEELVPSLTALRSAGRTTVVLGLRDVLDEPGQARREWDQAHHTEHLRDFYDAVWVYGDAQVHDLRATLFGAIPPPVSWHETGYLLPELPTPPEPESPGVEGYVVASVGAGGDGGDLLRALVEAEVPHGHRLVLVGGPDLPDEVHQDLIARARPGVEVHGMHPDTRELISGASAVIGMGGYNSVCEAVASGHPVLVVPRVTPRTEQLVRAEAMARHGLLDLLHPDDASPQALAAWMRTALGRPSVVPTRPAAGSTPARDGLRLDGLAQVRGLARTLLAPTSGGARAV